MLRPISPIIEYALNQDYIVEFLCINKSKPELQCKGKCHLAKELQKSQEEEKNSLRINLEEYPLSPLYKLEDILEKARSNYYSSVLNSEYKNLYFYLYSYNFFHPPIF